MTKQFSSDIRVFSLDAEREAELFAQQNECVFIWTTKAGEPVGVAMSYMVADGKSWLILTDDRARVAAIRRDPRSAICISSAGTDMQTGKAITYKGTTRVHANDAPEVAGWFFEAFAKRLHRGDNADLIREIASDLDIPQHVVLKFTPGKPSATMVTSLPQARECGLEVLALDRFGGGGATAYRGGVIYAYQTRQQQEA